MSQKRMEYFRLLLEHLAWIEHPFLNGIRGSRKAAFIIPHRPWGMMEGVGRVKKSIHQSWLAKGLELGLLFWFIYAYSLSSEAVVMRQLRRWKRLWRRSLIRWYKRTSMGPSRRCGNDTTIALQPKEITSKGTRVSCVYYQ